MPEAAPGDHRPGPADPPVHNAPGMPHTPDPAHSVFPSQTSDAVVIRRDSTGEQRRITGPQAAALGLPPDAATWTADDARRAFERTGP